MTDRPHGRRPSAIAQQVLGGEDPQSMQSEGRQAVLARGARVLARALATAMLMTASPAAAEPQPPASSDPGPASTRDHPGEADEASVLDALASRLSFRGFGTLGLVYSSEDQADFVGNLFQPNGAGHNRPVDFGVDSKLGAQMDVRITDSLSAVVQVVSQHRYDNRYWPDLEWANLKYEFTPDVSVRAGRTVSGTFLVSESRLVGFAYPWVRPPLEVYGLSPITSRDGIDASYRFRVHGFTNTIQLGYGATTEQLPDGSDGGSIDAKNYFEISNTTERGPFSTRIGVSYGRVDVRSELDELLDAFTAFGNAIDGIPGLEPAAAQARRIVERYELDDAPIWLLTVGGTYDPGDWLLMAELARFEGSGFLSDATAWYVTGGYRIGAFTPYLTYAWLRADHRFDAGITTTGLPLELATGASGLNAGLESTLASLDFSQTTMAVGVRWDFRRDAAVKLQYEHVDLRSGSPGRLGNVQSDFDPGGRVDVISLTIDFVF
jgi:hypothetical protein